MFLEQFNTTNDTTTGSSITGSVQSDDNNFIIGNNIESFNDSICSDYPHEGNNVVENIYNNNTTSSYIPILPNRNNNNNRRRRNSINTDINQYDKILNNFRKKNYREIETTPYRILDAPGVIDDYYLNLLDWTSNRISICLNDAVYCYDYTSKEVSSVFNTKRGYISSVKGKDNILAIGDSEGRLRIYDYVKEKIINSKKIHSSRISAISFNDRILSSGDKEGSIFNFDLRGKSKISEFKGHKQEICGLKWSPNDYYLASGSNDNTVKVWKMGSSIPKTFLGHNSAVKAIDWCSWKHNVLCTGGGTQDKTIRMWDVVSQKEIERIQTDSQVCTLHCLPRHREIITSHGFYNYDLKLWKTDKMKCVKKFGEHDSRILHTALSPDCSSIISLGPDESLKFWQIDEKSERVYKRDSLIIR